MATEHPWMFTRTYEDSIPEKAGDDRILDIDLSDHKWSVEAFKYNEGEETLIIRDFSDETQVSIWIFKQPTKNEYSQLREIGRDGDPDEFHEWFEYNIVDPERFEPSVLSQVLRSSTT